MKHISSSYHLMIGANEFTRAYGHDDIKYIEDK